MKYTHFFDMNSGGSSKEDWESIVVNLPREQAIDWFEDYFGHHPYDVACECCGENYSIEEVDSPKSFDEMSLFDKYSYKIFEV